MYENEKRILPDFPRTRHLPIDPHASRDDLVASQAELEEFLACRRVYIEEKVDGANCGICVYQGQPIVRNRSHILNKGYIGRGTPAKEQFAPIWTWVYAHLAQFQALEERLGFLPSVYGEWLYARHSVPYNALPDWFVAYDIYDSGRQRFVHSGTARSALLEAGFAVVPILAGPGQFAAEALLGWRDGGSDFSTEAPREGIYLKGCDEMQVLYRYKMVGGHFQTDPQWAKKPLVRNTILKVR